jgi:hypothetical protein
LQACALGRVTRRLGERTLDPRAAPCAYRCAYRLVSKRCSSWQLAAATKVSVCRRFQLLAARCSSFRRTLNPKVEGSNPSRPIQRLTARLESYGCARQTCRRRRCCAWRAPTGAPTETRQWRQRRTMTGQLHEEQATRTPPPGFYGGSAGSTSSRAAATRQYELRKEPAHGLEAGRLRLCWSVSGGEGLGRRSVAPVHQARANRRLSTALRLTPRSERWSSRTGEGGTSPIENHHSRSKSRPQKA